MLLEFRFYFSSNILYQAQGVFDLISSHQEVSWNEVIGVF